MALAKIVKEIKELKIQGAQAISIAALLALKEEIHRNHSETRISLLRRIAKAKSQLEKARPTEPALRNSLNYVLRHSKGDSVRELKESFLENIQKILKGHKHSEEVISKIGALKVKRGSVVFTHCHSSTVTRILILAKQSGKNFEVHNTETRPRFQGRITAKELAAKGIKVKHYVDSAAHYALKKADMVLLGCDAFTSTGAVINKIGSAMIAEIAHRIGIPVFICTSTFKFDPETIKGIDEPIESRPSLEVWQNPPKNVYVQNPAFEVIDPEFITGMITELGIYRPVVLMEEIRDTNPWMFQ